MTMLCWSLVYLSVVPLIFGLSEFQALEVVKGFADKFLSPSNVEVASTINRYAAQVLFSYLS